jgi:hypothetical protein
MEFMLPSGIDNHPYTSAKTMPYKKYKSTNTGSPAQRAFAGGGFALIVLVVAWLWLAETPERVRKPLPEMMLTAAPSALAPAAAVTKPLKLVYRNSVIPGGVHSAAELAAAVQRDPAVAAHYADFNVAAAHLVLVEQSRLVHVSYRIGDKIYWTKKKVRLALGENLLSDGKHLVRTRCGNRIADEPEGPVLDNEPAPEVLEAVFVSSDDLIDQTVNLAGVNGGAAPATVTNTAATVAQAPNERFASNLATIPAAVFPTLWDLRTPSPSTPALRFDPVTFAPPVAERSDADVFGTVGATPPQPTGAPPISPVPEGTTTPSPNPTGNVTTPNSPTPGTKTPKTPNTPTQDSKTPTTAVPDTNTPTPNTKTPDSNTPNSPAPDLPPPLSPPSPLGPQLIPATTSGPTPVPEPGSAALVGLALIALMLARKLTGRRRLS